MQKSNTTKVFSERLTDLIADKNVTLRQIEHETGISAGALSKYTNEEAEAKITAIAKLAEFFNVSTDYLLGRTNAPTVDKTVQFICDYTDLSQKAVETLHNRKDCVLINSVENINEQAFALSIMQENFFDLFSELQSDFICSDHFYEIIRVYIFETLIKKKLDELQQINATELNKSETIRSTLNFVKNWKSKHRIHLFDVQDYATSFIKELANLDNSNYNDIDINDLLLRFYGESEEY